MFEVSWCVGLYVTILLLEFLPVPLERYGYTRTLELWKRWQGAYVAFAVTLFVYMLSRNVLYAAGAAIVFGTLAWVFRARDAHPEFCRATQRARSVSTSRRSRITARKLALTLVGF